MNSNSIQLTIHFIDSKLNEDEREEMAQRLLTQLRDMNEVESANRILNPNPPKNSKIIGGVLIGLLNANVSWSNFAKVMQFLSDRLCDKDIELEVTANGRKLKVTASSREELEIAIKAAQDFVQEAGSKCKS